MTLKNGLVCVLVGGFALLGCNKKSDAAGGETATETATAEPVLVEASAPGPSGYQWERVPQGGLGSVELPKGEGWRKDGNELSNEALNITVMIQQQAGVDASARSEYLQSFIDVNKRDAPKYELAERKEGQVKGHASGRVDGKFDNGTAYSTRDYVMFVKNAVLSVMVRGPVAREAEIRSLADHVAASYQ